MKNSQNVTGKIFQKYKSISRTKEFKKMSRKLSKISRLYDHPAKISIEKKCSPKVRKKKLSPKNYRLIILHVCHRHFFADRHEKNCRGHFFSSKCNGYFLSHVQPSVEKCRMRDASKKVSRNKRSSESYRLLISFLKLVDTLGIDFCTKIKYFVYLMITITA